jgi:RNA polymerase sigma factor (sigma-70 family)
MSATDHFFRHESARLVAVLTRVFGVHNLDLVEDVVQDAICRALEVWKFRGIPENPSAWLMATAKNRALDVLRRERTARKFAPELERQLLNEQAIAPALEGYLDQSLIQDDLLSMIFTCCHPRLPEVAQVSLVLHILCGFSVDEVASAFVSKPAAIEKRIQRGKKTLAGSPSLFDISAPAALSERLPAVHRALYLLFNEGYHGASPDSAVRSDLCREAMRLAALLLKNPVTATPTTYALSALMCLNAARLPARVDTHGNLSSLADQDRSLWDRTLVTEGLWLLERSMQGPVMSEYHLEAGIGLVHAAAGKTEDTDWKSIAGMYDLLLGLRPSPVVALNRAIAIAQSEGPERGLAAIYAIEDPERLAGYPFYAATLGELELRSGRSDRARERFEEALATARNPMERRFLLQRIAACESAVGDVASAEAATRIGVGPSVEGMSQDPDIARSSGIPEKPLSAHEFYKRFWEKALERFSSVDERARRG